MSYQPLKHAFNEKDILADVVAQHYDLLPVLSRFGIPLGFGHLSIGEVCQRAGIDVNVFLLIVNFTLTGIIDLGRLERVSPTAIVDFLQNSHRYFLAYKFPHIRANLMAALEAEHTDINPAIIRYFDDYLKQVERHFAYEERRAFPYIRQLYAGTTPDNYSIAVFQRHHDEVTFHLTELKNLILRFYTTARPDLMYDVLVDICNAEEDLLRHADIENNILIPMVQAKEAAGKEGDQ